MIIWHFLDRIHDIEIALYYEDESGEGCVEQVVASSPTNATHAHNFKWMIASASQYIIPITSLL